jgi:cytochrome oxidase Cu insertion factor (SCO1/SenC/PrrC family)
MPRLMKFLVVAALLLFLSSAGVLMLVSRGGGGGGDSLRQPSAPSAWRPETDNDPLKPDDAAHGLSIPPFTLVTQSGGTLTREELAGRVTIVNFIFTHCPFICPLMTERMKDLSVQLKGTGVRCLSISVDPERDMPARLAEYAALHGADPAVWTFATGRQDDLDAIVEDGLKFALEDDPNRPIPLPDGSKMNNILHPGWFVLIGPDARPLGVYASGDPAAMEVLAARARAASSQVRPVPPADPQSPKRPVPPS